MDTLMHILFSLLFLAGAANAVQAADAHADIRATTLMKASNSWDGNALVYPSGTPEVTVLTIDIAPGAQTGWHAHPVPSFALVLEGPLEVTQESGATKLVRTGEVLSEVVNVAHNGRAVGDRPVKLLVMYTGASGQAITLARARSSSPD